MPSPGPARDERIARAEWLSRGTMPHIPIDELNEMLDSRDQEDWDRIGSPRR